MKIEEFYQQFEGLDSQIAYLEGETCRQREEVRTLEKRLEMGRFIRDVLNGLKRHEENDPGKNRRAFYFVSELTDNSIIGSRSNEPSLYKSCPRCGKNQPVLMWYAQTFDSPDGDNWASEAFVICEGGLYSCKGRVYTLARFDSPDRFLYLK